MESVVFCSYDQERFRYDNGIFSYMFASTGLLAISDYAIPSEVYSWTAVFILPINSALNPIIYTLSSIKMSTVGNSVLYRLYFVSICVYENRPLTQFHLVVEACYVTCHN